MPNVFILKTKSINIYEFYVLRRRRQEIKELEGKQREQERREMGEAHMCIGAHNIHTPNA